MDLKALGYFVAAYEEGNITAAAKRCHISQPSISAAILGLEEKLAITVFTRHKRGVTPTVSGDQLYARARPLISDANALKSFFRPVKKIQALTLGVMSALDVNRVMSLLKPLIESQNQLDLHLSRDDEPCDARIICVQSKKEYEEFIPLWSERFVVAFPEGHPLILKEELFITDLADVAWVARDYCGNELMDAANHIGLKFNTVATAFSEEWAVALVAAGIGVAILPEGLISSEHKIVVRSFSNMEIGRQVGLAYDGRTKPSSGLQLMLALEAITGQT
ncbi:MAG: LysR family transcriptional regulator [Moraxellaceae bacterium]|nr:MAG: LysR family transcriptional regulator [Moraxellaceae bacterium]